MANMRFSANAFPISVFPFPSIGFVIYFRMAPNMHEFCLSHLVWICLLYILLESLYFQSVPLLELASSIC